MQQRLSHFKKYFRGLWRIDRVIENARGEKRGSMQGLARITAVSKQQLYYQESLRHRLEQGAFLDAHQSYLFELRNSSLKIYFPSREKLCHTLFLDLSFDAEGKAAASHLCDQDLYLAHFHLINTQHWKMIYHVEGPAKTYSIKSNLTRID
jgi:hypothetical protein